ncbi:MAG: porin [Bacteroidales bacterium]|nr:porin [Bacteroidales bacterium]
MKRNLLFILFALTSLAAAAQNEKTFRLDLETRIDYTQEYISSTKINDNSGFKGKYLNIRIDGQIAEGFTYSYRQRLNKINSIYSFFEATDWITLNYRTGNWDFSTGKQVVAIGGYEYNAAPIDLYFCSEFWQHIACYQFGVSAAYNTKDRKDNIMFQICESPFKTGQLNIEKKEMFAYNLMWTGTHGFFNSLYSVNMMEYMPGRFINYIALGNEFRFGNVRIELDLMNKASSMKDLIGKNMSVMSAINWQPVEWVNMFARMSYDVNRTEELTDLCVLPGTEITRVGGGFEFFPIKNSRNLRLHINGCYTFGKATVGNVLNPNQTIVDCGITWKMNLLTTKR